MKISNFIFCVLFAMVIAVTSCYIPDHKFPPSYQVNNAYDHKILRSGPQDIKIIFTPTREYASRLQHDRIKDTKIVMYIYDHSRNGYASQTKNLKYSEIKDGGIEVTFSSSIDFNYNVELQRQPFSPSDFVNNAKFVTIRANVSSRDVAGSTKLPNNAQQVAAPNP